MDSETRALLSSASPKSSMPSTATAIKPRKNLGVTPIHWASFPITSTCPGLSSAGDDDAAEAVPTALIVVSRGSVVDFRGDAIVNAANVGCQGGAGVDGAINERGGPALREARANLPVLDGDGTRCRTGTAVCTVGGQLPAKWCIHAVGPIFGFEDVPSEKDQELYSAYRSAMERAREVQAKTLGFALLSAGIFRGARSRREILRIGLEAIQAGLYPGLEEVHMVAFNMYECKDLELLAKEIWKAQSAQDGAQTPSVSSGGGFSCCRRRAPPAPSAGPTPGSPTGTPSPTATTANAGLEEESFKGSGAGSPQISVGGGSPGTAFSPGTGMEATATPPSGASPCISDGPPPSVAPHLPKREL
mmetsp:Transcript_3092/g.7490  ORF Transcript_3092/g.7490 Transcript_3092/m.7490 type:complete len:361 (-) Transcript_3092:61-1143(-)